VISSILDDIYHIIAPNLPARAALATLPGIVGAVPLLLMAAVWPKNSGADEFDRPAALI
jgi:hypothetical protein